MLFSNALIVTDTMPESHPPSSFKNAMDIREGLVENLKGVSIDGSTQYKTVITDDFFINEENQKRWVEALVSFTNDDEETLTCIPGVNVSDGHDPANMVFTAELHDRILKEVDRKILENETSKKKIFSAEEWKAKEEHLIQLEKNVAIAENKVQEAISKVYKNKNIILELEKVLTETSKIMESAKLKFTKAKCDNYKTKIELKKANFNLRESENTVRICTKAHKKACSAVSHVKYIFIKQKRIENKEKLKLEKQKKQVKLKFVNYDSLFSKLTPKMRKLICQLETEQKIKKSIIFIFLKEEIDESNLSFFSIEDLEYIGIKKNIGQNIINIFNNLDKEPKLMCPITLEVSNYIRSNEQSCYNI